MTIIFIVKSFRSPSGEEILLKQEAFILDEATDDDDIVSYYKKN